MDATNEHEYPQVQSDVNELPREFDNGSKNTIEENQQPIDEASKMEQVQEEAAEERKEGGYQ